MRCPWIASVIVSLLIACGTPDDQTICAQAVARINECAGGSFAVAPTACDEEAAQEILLRSCQELAAAQADEKADGPGDVLRAAACGVGFLRHCSVNVCPAPRYPALGGACIDYPKSPGCGGCQYYSCRDDKAASGCGARGYYLGYGGRYCERFLQVTQPRLSAAGQRFLDAVRDCLVDYLETQVAVGSACAEVKDRAIASHVTCYKESGFCALPVKDQLLVLNTIDLQDVDLLTVLRTGLACLSR